MADERDLELLDDYLTNRLSDEDRSAFEQKLQADPDLQHEYSLQRRLIQGIKDARVAELKSMLNNVPVPPAGGSAVAAKALLGVVATIIIAAAAYWFMREDDADISPKIETEETVPAVEQPQTQVVPESRIEEQPSVTPQRPTAETDKNQTSAGTEHSRPSLSKKPDPVSAPGEKKNEQTGVGEPERISGLVVETDSENERYAFHYQFRAGKLFLYGPFEENQYEIIELAGDNGRVFLFHKERYYFLQKGDDQIKVLSAVTDESLLRRLEEYRSLK